MGEHEIFLDFLRTADDKRGYHLSNINNHHPNLSIRSENVDIEMQVHDRHTNEHTALKRLGGNFIGRKRGSAVFGPYLKRLSYRH